MCDLNPGVRMSPEPSIPSPPETMTTAALGGALQSARHAPAAPLVSGARGHVLRPLLKTMRPHQWVKNLFVMAPMFFHKDVFLRVQGGGTFLNLTVTSRAAAATGIFCLLAGAVYTINDLVDVEADRVHPIKKGRPIASG